MQLYMCMTEVLTEKDGSDGSLGWLAKCVGNVMQRKAGKRVDMYMK
jgi:hypothetical protein